MSEIILNNILPQILHYLRMVSIVLSFLLLLGIIFFTTKTAWIKDTYLDPITEFLKSKPYKSKKFAKQWSNITAKLRTGNELEYKLAIIEADGLLEQTLEKMKFEGETVKERLAKVPKIIIGDVKNIEKAQEIRDKVVHEPDYQLSLEETKEVLNIYEKIFKQFNF